MEKVSICLNFVLFLAVFNSGQAAIINARKNPTKLNVDLKELGEYMKLEMPCLGLAPLRKDFQKFEMDEATWSAKGNLTKFTLDGLNKFDIDVFNWNPRLNQTNFKFTFPKLKIVSLYKVNGVYNKTGTPKKIFGNGIFRLELIHLTINGSFKLVPALEGKAVAISNFTTAMKLKESHSTSTGFMNGDKATEAFNFSVEKIVNLLIADQKISELLKSGVEMAAKKQPISTTMEELEFMLEMIKSKKMNMKPNCNKKI